MKWSGRTNELSRVVKFISRLLYLSTFLLIVFPRFMLCASRLLVICVWVIFGGLKKVMKSIQTSSSHQVKSIKAHGHPDFPMYH